MVAVKQFTLSDAILEKIHSRAASYDRENKFFSDDFNDLKKAGYLHLAVPTEFRGYGFNVAQVAQLQRRLAYNAPATALAINMHFYFTGVAADLWRSGDKSLERMLRETMKGEVFAAGHAETGNDLPLLLSTTKAEKAPGGYKFTGRKSFGSLTPVWTRLGIHAMDASNPNAPMIVHAFMPRDAKGYSIKETWDVLGMRATRSDDTILDGAFVPDKYIGRVLPAGAVDQFVLSVFAWADIGFSNVYYGIALRARDLAVEGLKKRTSLGLTRSMAYHPEMQHAAAEMTLELESMGPHIDKVAQDWANGVDHGHNWPMKIVSAKYHCVEGAGRVVDLALEMSGGFGMFKASELERLYRDVRCGRFHPANSALVHEIVGKTTLGIGLDEQPRWG